MKTAAYIFGSLILLVFLLLIIIGTFAPETHVYLGQQVPKKYKSAMKKLDLLEEGEKIKYFYSNGLTSIKSGLYCITDKKLIIYCDAWEEPKILIDFLDITHLSFEKDSSFLGDSYIYLITNKGDEIQFPVANEKGRDQLFYNYLKRQSMRSEDDKKPMESDQYIETDTLSKKSMRDGAAQALSAE